MARLAAALLIGTSLAALGAGAAAAADYDRAMTYNTPYGTSPGTQNQPINPSTRDGNGNRLVVNGRIVGGSYSESSGSSFTSGAGSSASGVGFGSLTSATAIGNQLTVITQGSWNTVIVDAEQTNNGNQTATVSKDGGK